MHADEPVRKGLSFRSPRNAVLLTAVALVPLGAWLLFPVGPSPALLFGVAALIGLIALALDGRFTAQLPRSVNENALPLNDTRQLQTILDRASAVIYIKDRHGRHLMANRAFEKFFGRPRAQIIGQTNHDLFAPEVAQNLDANDRQVLATGSALEWEEIVPHPDGPRTFLSIKFPLGRPDQEPDAICGISTDITERKRAEEQLRHEKDFSERLVFSSIDGILAFDRQCRYTVWNPAMERLTGMKREQVLGRCAFEVFPFLRETGEDHYFHEALAGRSVISHDRLFTVPESGQQGFFEGYYAPLHDQAGAVIGGLAVIRDVTDRRRAEEERAQLLREQAARAAAEESSRKLTFLDEAARVLATSLDYATTLQTLAHLCVPALGDLCIIDVVSEEHRLERLGTAHADPAKASLLDELRGRFAPGPDDPHPAARVWRSGEPELLAEVSDEVVQAHTRDPNHFALIRALGIRSHLAVPMTARGRPVGVLGLAVTESARRYTADDLALAQELANHAALAVDNARLYREAQREVAERQQAEEALRQSEQAFRAVFEQSPLSTQIFLPDGRPIRVNRAWEQLWGTRLQDIPDYNILRDPQLVAKDIMPFIQKGFAGESASIPAIGYNPNDTLPGRTRYEDPLRWVRAFIYPVKDSTGRVIEVVLVHEDITAQRQAEEQRRCAEQALRESEERFRLALSSGLLTVYQQDRDLRYVWVYPQDPAFVQGNIGRSDSELLPPDEADVLMRIKRQVLETGQTHREIIRATLPGTVRYYDLAVQPWRDHEGDVVGVGGVAVDVTDRHRAEEEVRRRVEQLAEADRRKDEFLAMLAHELRNPLAPIRNAAHILRLLAREDANLDRARSVIDRQLGHLTRLVDDLLDVSRITRGKVQIKPEPIDLAAVIAQAVETSRPLIEARRHELHVQLPPVAVRLMGDLVRLSQSVSNLLNNAAKYAEEGGRIDLIADQSGSEAIIRVRDTGVGIPPNMLPEIFDLFTQVDRTLDRSQGGLGIGLTLAKSLVEMHGGTIHAQSDGPGRGSEFTIRLPTLPSLPPDFSHEPPSPAGTTPQRQVLIVDDNKDVAHSLALMLQFSGHQTQVALDGPAALRLAQSFRPDVVLLDIGLPGMNGYEVAGQLRQLPGWQSIILIALTGYGQDEDRRRALDAGFDIHLTKPVAPETLTQLLADLPTRK